MPTREKGNSRVAARRLLPGENTMESLLLELLEVNRQILTELRMLRHDLGQQDTERPQAVGLEAPLAEPPAKTPARTTAKDLEDIRGALMNGLKLRNKNKSRNNAFSEFEKRHKDW